MNQGMYVNPNFVTEGNETKRYMDMIKREKAYAAYQQKMQARKPKKKIVPIVVLSVAVAAACTAAYKAINDLKNGYSEIPVPRAEVVKAQPEIIIEASEVVETVAQPEATTI